MRGWPVVAGAVLLLALSGCAAAAPSPSAPPPSAGDGGAEDAAVVDSCAHLEVKEGVVIAGSELGACLVDTMRAANTFHFDVADSVNHCSGDGQLDPFMLKESCTGGDAYVIRDQHIWQTGGDGAPRDAEIGYQGDDYEKMILAAAGALAISQSPLTTTETMIGQSDWEVRPREAHADARGTSVTGWVFAAQQPITMWGVQLSDQRFFVDDSFGLVAITGTASLEGFTSAVEQRYSDWGAPVDIPAP